MRVPRVTEQQVAIAPLPNARQRLSVSADTFGAQRARRLSQGAEGLADAADGLARVAFERQAERIEAEAEEALARWQIAATDTLAGYRSLQGGDAVGAYEAARAELDGLQARIGRELGGGSGKGSGRDGGGQGGRERGRGRAHALYAQQVANRLPSFAAGLERHRDAQSRVYRTAAMEARLQSAVAAGLADPSLGPGAELEIHALARQQGETLGLPPETVEAIALGHISQIHLGRLEGLLAEGRGAEARVYLKTYGPGMTAAERLRLDTKTKAVERTAEVKALYQAIVSGGQLPASARERGAAADEGAETGQGRGSDPGASPADPGPDGVTPQAVPAPPLSPPTTFGPRATAAEAKAAAQAELLAGSPQAAAHRLHLERMERLAEVETEDPRVLAGAADELTAAYERETATLQADKATAQAEIARSLRAGTATPASLPPDLAAVLSEEERDELDDWWRTGLRVEPDAALFEALHELFPAFPDEVSLEAPSIARHLSQEQHSLVRRRQAETRTPGAPGAAEVSATPTAGPMEGESGSVRLDDLDGTFEEVNGRPQNGSSNAQNSPDSDLGGDETRSPTEFTSVQLPEQQSDIDVNTSRENEDPGQSLSSNDGVLPAEVAAALRQGLGDEIFEQLVSTLDVMDMADRMGLDRDLVEQAGPRAVPAIAATLVYSQLEPRDQSVVLGLVQDLREEGYGRLAFELRGLVASQLTIGEPHNRYIDSRQPIPLAGPESPKLDAEMEARLRDLVGDKTFEQIWYRDVHGMARLMDIDPSLVDAAGAEGVAALAATAAFRQIPQRDRIIVNRAIETLRRSGHGYLAFQLRGKIGSQSSLGKEHNRYSMTTEELIAANTFDERALAVVEGTIPLRFLQLPPHVRAPVFVILAVLRYKLRSSIAERKSMIEERRR